MLSYRHSFHAGNHADVLKHTVQSLIIESLKWMTDTEDSATVSIPSKSLSVSYLTLTDYDAAFWKICTIGLIPGFFLVVGFVVWMKRRKA